MSAGFLEGDFDLQATDEPGEDIARTDVEIGSQEGLRFEFAFGIANEQPADRHWRRAAAIPDGSAAGDLDEAVGSAVPQAVRMAESFLRRLPLMGGRPRPLRFCGGKANRLASSRSLVTTQT